MSRKLGLALGAGGSRGVAHIGFLQALDEIGLRPDFIAGCSMGAIVGGCYCAGVTPAEMRTEVSDLKLTDIATLNLSPLHQNGVLKLSKARKLIADVMGEREFSELKIPFVCVATDLDSGKTVVLDRGNVVDAVIASSSIPGVFSPAQFGEYRMLVDGGLLERVPAREVHTMGAEVIVAVDVLGNLPDLKNASGRLFNTVLRCIDIMETQTSLNKRRFRKFVDLWLEPALEDMDQYSVKNLPFAYERGYELGVAYRERIARMVE